MESLRRCRERDGCPGLTLCPGAGMVGAHPIMNAGLDLVEPRRSTLPFWTFAVLVARAAILLAAAWLGLTVYRRATPRFGDDFWAFVLALAVPLLLVGGGWLFREAGRRFADRAAIARIARGGPRKAGSWVAVAGKARAVRGTFEAPLSGRPALACRYASFDRPYRRRGTNTGRAAAMRLRACGFHLAPTVIEGKGERIRLLGFPQLTGLEKSHLGSGFSAIDDAAPRGPVWPVRKLRLARLFASAGDEVHIDWRFGADDERAQPGRRDEWVLPPDAEVCVAGRWSEEGALRPHWARTSGLPVYPGAPEAATKALRSEARIYLALAAILLGAGAAILAWVAL